jgi:hypothetical protein
VNAGAANAEDGARIAIADRQTADENAWNQKNHLDHSQLESINSIDGDSPPRDQTRMIDNELLDKLNDLQSTFVQCKEASSDF